MELKEGKHAQPFNRASMRDRSRRSQAACPADNTELISHYIGSIRHELSRNDQELLIAPPFPAKVSPSLADNRVSIKYS
jgi:hypothetical protein